MYQTGVAILKLSKDVIKILTEYEKLSDGKLIIEKYEGKPNSYIEDQADKNGILPLQVQFLSGNEIDSKKVYLGLSFSYQGRQDIIPVVASVSGLEYKINKILYYFTLDKKGIILKVKFDRSNTFRI